MSQFAEWDSFYVIIGSPAGGLIGLQFVVMTLLAERPHPRLADAAAAFATPTIVHFCAVLLLAALLRAPWPAITLAASCWGIMGVAGIIYEVIVARLMRKQAIYQPVFEDSLFHLLLPLIAYTILALSSLAAGVHVRSALFGVATAALILLFTAIHNAWDAVAYHVLVGRAKIAESRPLETK